MLLYATTKAKKYGGVLIILIKKYCYIYWPEVEVLLDGDLVGYNCVKFSLKLVKFSNLTLILHNKDGRAIVNVGELIKHNKLGVNCYDMLLCGL